MLFLAFFHERIEGYVPEKVYQRDQISTIWQAGEILDPSDFADGDASLEEATCEQREVQCSIL